MRLTRLSDFHCGMGGLVVLERLMPVQSEFESRTRNHCSLIRFVESAWKACGLEVQRCGCKTTVITRRHAKPNEKLVNRAGYRHVHPKSG